MSENDKTGEEAKIAADNSMEMIFQNAFFAAMTGAALNDGKDPGSLVNRAYVLAERAVERFSSGKPVMTDAERGAAVMEAVQNAPRDSAGQPIAPQARVAGPNVTQLGGVFPRPGATP